MHPCMYKHLYDKNLYKSDALVIAWCRVHLKQQKNIRNERNICHIARGCCTIHLGHTTMCSLQTRNHFPRELRKKVDDINIQHRELVESYSADRLKLDTVP